MRQEDGHTWQMYKPIQRAISCIICRRIPNRTNDNVGDVLVATIEAVRVSDATVKNSQDVLASDFPDAENYHDFWLNDIQLDSNDSGGMDYRVYWWGQRNLWVDYVEVYEESAYWILVEHDYDDDIETEVTLYRDFDALFRWYLADEPEPDEIHCYCYVDGLIRNQCDPAHPGITTASHRYSGFWNDFVSIAQPHELFVDIYPISSETPTSGQDFQNRLSNYLLRGA